MTLYDKVKIMFEVSKKEQVERERNAWLSYLTNELPDILLTASSLGDRSINFSASNIRRQGMDCP